MTSAKKDLIEQMRTLLNKLENTDERGKKAYVKCTWNKIEDLDLNTIVYETCLFLKDGLTGEVDIPSSDITVGYISKAYLNKDINEIKILTDRACAYDDNNKPMHEVLENLTSYKYVIMLKEII